MIKTALAAYAGSLVTLLALDAIRMSFRLSSRSEKATIAKIVSS
jgi:hypothetical protein